MILFPSRSSIIVVLVEKVLKYVALTVVYFYSKSVLIVVLNPLLHNINTVSSLHHLAIDDTLSECQALIVCFFLLFSCFGHVFVFLLLKTCSERRMQSSIPKLLCTIPRLCVAYGFSVRFFSTLGGSRTVKHVDLFTSVNIWCDSSLLFSCTTAPFLVQVFWQAV